MEAEYFAIAVESRSRRAPVRPMVSAGQHSARARTVAEPARRRTMTPLCIDLFAGMFGFSAGWLELGGRVIGFDLEHLPHHGPVPVGAELVLQDVRAQGIGAGYR